jgi:hypothetical protein
VRKKVGDKVKGAAQFFVTDTVTSPSTETDTVEVAVTSPDTKTSTATVEDTTTVTDTVEVAVADTVTDTVTSPLIKPTEILNRMIGYYTDKQKKFIRSKAKHYKIKEAEVMRIAMDELMKSGKI